MVFYLKINRDNSYVVTNFKHWLEAATRYDGSLVYIVCDNPSLKERIISQIRIDYNKVFFIESLRDCDDINHILDNICECDKWKRVGQAHLTTHWHAKEHEYNKFWNIDADDTFICLDPIRIVDMMKKVEEYSDENSIVANGLDMWRSMSISEQWAKGDNWSLGITYIDNRIDWMDIFAHNCGDFKMDMNIEKHDSEVNVDWFFTYLRRKKVAKIETFYVENMKFMHFYDYFFNYPHLSMFCRWKNGKIEYPILESCFGASLSSKIKIADDIIKFDIDVKDDEGMLALINSCGEKFAFCKELYSIDLDVGDVLKRKNVMYMKNKECDELVCWGSGKFFRKNIELMRKIYNVKYVCDNDQNKWGKSPVEGVVCISPKTLKKMNNVMVILMIEDIKMNYNIVHQLMDMGIYKFEHFENWLEIVEGE